MELPWPLSWLCASVITAGSSVCPVGALCATHGGARLAGPRCALSSTAFRVGNGASWFRLCKACLPQVIVNITQLGSSLLPTVMNQAERKCRFVWPSLLLSPSPLHMFPPPHNSTHPHHTHSPSPLEKNVFPAFSPSIPIVSSLSPDCTRLFPVFGFHSVLPCLRIPLDSSLTHPSFPSGDSLLSPCAQHTNWYVKDKRTTDSPSTTATLCVGLFICPAASRPSTSVHTPHYTGLA
mmetsp:Transcript_29012/g.85880  ORF Transcript_29012/g.85880 Transcript_29012/m.85880 type:complete len:236 (+) Transcript_29012:19-726(+)